MTFEETESYLQSFSALREKVRGLNKISPTNKD
jgi:hypothetical protein